MQLIMAVARYLKGKEKETITWREEWYLRQFWCQPARIAAVSQFEEHYGFEGGDYVD